MSICLRAAAASSRHVLRLYLRRVREHVTDANPHMQKPRSHQHVSQAVILRCGSHQRISLVHLPAPVSTGSPSTLPVAANSEYSRTTHQCSSPSIPESPLPLLPASMSPAANRSTSEPSCSLSWPPSQRSHRSSMAWVITGTHTSHPTAPAP